jgi:hypothetical protein
MTSDGAAVQCVGPNRTGFWERVAEVSSSLCWVDTLVFALIIGFGAFQFYYTDRASYYLDDDVFYADTARSLIDHGFYGINGYPESNMPPGVSLFLVLLSAVGAGSHVVCLRAMVVFGTLAFLGSYELLRRQVPRGVAAAICLLLMSSQNYFLLVSQLLSSGAPYFFTTILALLTARKLEQATRLTARLVWGALLAVFISASLAFHSAAIAFLGAIVASIAVPFFRDRRLAVGRLKTYFAVLVIGIAVQGSWMHRGVEASAGISAQEWPVAGFPHSYLAQLKVKDGRYPELGMVTLSSIPARILKHAYEHANFLSQMLLKRWIYLAWMSIVTIGVLILIAVGWCYSVWLSGGGGLQEWYFAGYEFMYFLWPWQLEGRFFLPIAPLACLYLWRAGKAVVFLARNRPRLLGLIWFPIATFLAVNSWFWMRGIGRASFLPHAGFQDETSVVVWLLSAIFAAWMVWADTGWTRQASGLFRWCTTPLGALRMSSLRFSQVLSLLLVACMVGKGVESQVGIGRANLDLNSETNRFPPDAEAGQWINSHTDTNAVVMARHVPMVFHYSKRNVIWFPPSSDPQLLMDGILRHKINFVIVVLRDFNYYLPSDTDCFDPLLKAYPDAFRVVDQSPVFKIYQVVPSGALPSLRVF